MRKNSIKNIRINEEVMRALSTIIREEVKDPRIHPLTSVSGVEVAPDLKTCKVYISVLGSDQELSGTVEGLKSASGYIRRTLAHSLNMRNTPQLTFLADRSIAYGVEMSKKIDALGQTQAAGSAEPDGDTAAQATNMEPDGNAAAQATNMEPDGNTASRTGEETS